jgi:hypothetical protein
MLTNGALLGRPLKDFRAARDCIAVKLAWHFALTWAAAAMAAGIWLAYDAWRRGSQPMAMLAAVLLLSAPMLAAAVQFARRAEPEGEDARVAGEWVSAIHAVDRSLRIVSLCRAHVGVGCSYLFVLWICQLTGYVNLPDFVIFYSVACVAAAGAFLPWLSSCERRLHDARAAYRGRLGELEAAR